MVSTGSTGGGEGPTGGGGGPTDNARSGVSEQPGRYTRSTSGMIGALVVTLLVIVGFVAFRAFNRSDLDVKPEHVDYLAQVRFAQQDGADLVYPARLPSGWYATRVTFSPGSPGSPGASNELMLSMLTAGGDYVGYVQSPATLSELLTTYVDAHPQAGEPVTVPGSVVPTWTTWTDTGGDTALATTHGRESLVAFGTVSQGRLEQLVRSLTSAPASG
jgi:hypothetical protein